MEKCPRLKVSDEVIDILRVGGLRCECFLGQVAEHHELLTAFSRMPGSELLEVDAGNEGTHEEPFYGFSDGRGRYNIDGLKSSLN
jgi:hypothetical protein